MHFPLFALRLLFCLLAAFPPLAPAQPSEQGTPPALPQPQPQPQPQQHPPQAAVSPRLPPSRRAANPIWRTLLCRGRGCQSADAPNRGPPSSATSSTVVASGPALRGPHVRLSPALPHYAPLPGLHDPCPACDEQIGHSLVGRRRPHEYPCGHRIHEACRRRLDYQDCPRCWLARILWQRQRERW